MCGIGNQSLPSLLFLLANEGLGLKKKKEWAKTPGEK
jgi:hypothetical protein